MSQEVAVIGLKELTWTPEQTKLIMDTLCKNATPDEAKLFFYRAKTMRLDPLKPGQIHFVKYNANSPGTIVVGIEGFRSIAGRSGKHAGTKRGVLRNDKGIAIGGWAEVYRSDWKEPARIEVSLTEYNKNSGPWKSMPESMIQKVAEAGALRMAFPDDLGGVYSQDEMDQAGKDPGIHPDQPGPSDGDGGLVNYGYMIDFGKWNKRSLEQVYRDEGPDAIAGYISYLEESAAKKGATPQGKVAIFLEQASAFLGAMENVPEASVEPREEDIPF